MQLCRPFRVRGRTSSQITFENVGGLQKLSVNSYTFDPVGSQNNVGKLQTWPLSCETKGIFIKLSTSMHIGTNRSKTTSV